MIMSVCPQCGQTYRCKLQAVNLCDHEPLVCVCVWSLGRCDAYRGYLDSEESLDLLPALLLALSRQLQPFASPVALALIDSSVSPFDDGVFTQIQGICVSWT